MTNSAAVTHRRILKIALPIVAANISVPLLGAVDTAVVGQMGLAAPIGAVGLGAVILASVYWIFGFLRMGTTGLAAQAIGAGDTAEAGAVLLRGLMIGLAAGAVFVALQAPLVWAAFRIAPASPEVESLARAYLAIRIWGAPATIALYAITGWLIATERTRGVLVLQLVMNGLNVGLDLLFVLGFGWGVEGVAVATLLAEGAGLALGLWLCRAAFASGAWRDRARLFARAPLRRMAAVNSDIMIRSVALQGAMTAFVFLSAGQGDVTLAANQVLWQFVIFAAYALDGFAFAAEALVGQAAGARSVAVLRRAGFLASGWALAAGAGLALGFWMGGPWIIDLMSTAPEVRAQARDWLPAVLVLVLIGVGPYMLDGIYIGATETRAMRDTMLLAVGAYALFLWLALPTMGNLALWVGLAGLNVTRAILLGALYPRLERRVTGVGSPVPEWR